MPVFCSPVYMSLKSLLPAAAVWKKFVDWPNFVKRQKCDRAEWDDDDNNDDYDGENDGSNKEQIRMSRMAVWNSSGRTTLGETIRSVLRVRDR